MKLLAPILTSLLLCPASSNFIEADEFRTKFTAFEATAQLKEEGWTLDLLKNSFELPKIPKPKTTFIQDQLPFFSEFVRCVKLRFTRWHNQKHGRRGTIWEERFGSVVVAEEERALRTMAPYIGWMV